MADTTELVPELLEAGVHFGHQTKRWNPKMKALIFEQRNQIYIINLDETVLQLRRATEFLQEVTRRGGRILFVGCKKQAQEAIKEAALACGHRPDHGRAGGLCRARFRAADLGVPRRDRARRLAQCGAARALPHDPATRTRSGGLALGLRHRAAGRAPRTGGTRGALREARR